MAQQAAFNFSRIHSETDCLFPFAANSIARNSSGLTRTRNVPAFACPLGRGGRPAFLALGVGIFRLLRESWCPTIPRSPYRLSRPSARWYRGKRPSYAQSGERRDLPRVRLRLLLSFRLLECLPFAYPLCLLLYPNNLNLSSPIFVVQ
jgi:hypothetical protein